MTEFINIAVPSRPEMVEETATRGTYEISGLYPGYGNTLGNALRRILLSSIPGIAIISVKVRGVPHEFSVIDHVKEDVLTLILRLKGILFSATTDTFPQVITLKKKGKGKITAGDFETPPQIKIKNKELELAEITDAKGSLDLEAHVQKGIGFCSRENLVDSNEVGNIVLDTNFSPVRRSSYEVRNMRIGDRTDFNKLTITVETDGTISPRDSLNMAIRTMMKQLEAMVSFQDENKEKVEEVKKEVQQSANAMLVSELGLSVSVANNLEKNGVKSVAGIMKKGVNGIRDISGIGEKALKEIVKALEKQGIVFKENTE